MELVKIKASEYGIEETKAQQIEAQFKPMLEKMAELEKEYNEVIKLEIDQETCKKAHALRLKYVKVRTGTAEIHKAQKDFYLQAGRYIDGWKNTQKFASQGIEDKLMAIEKHFENLEKEKKAKLQEKRAAEIKKYMEEDSVIPENLGDMPDEIWNNYLSGTKLNYETRIAAEKKAEEDRIAKEKAEAEERERIRLDNIRLEKEAKEREEKIKKEREEREKAEAERLEKEAKEKKIREEKEAKERAEHEAKLKAEREAKEKIEREAKEREEKLQSELRAKKEAEEKAEAERIALEQAELNKGDADKVKDLVNDLNSLKTKYVFKSAKNKKMYSDVSTLIDKVINHINQ